MRILIVHNAYQSSLIGGEDIIVQREIKALKSQLGDDSVFEFTVSNDNIRTASLLINLWGDKKNYKIIMEVVKKHGIDIVHVHNFFPLLTPSVFAAAKHAGAKVVHTLH